MKNKIFSLILILAGSGAAFAQGPLEFAAAMTKNFEDVAKSIGAELPPVPAAPEKAFKHPHPETLPEDCLNMPVLYVEDNELYANGVELGDRPSNYKGACNGDAAWTDTAGNIYKNKTELGRNAQSYEIALYTGDVFWKDGYGTLKKNSTEIGRAQNYKVSDYTGIVAWTDGYGNLYKDAKNLGRSSNYQITDHTGDVVWTDGYGTLSKNTEALGRSNKYMVADRTGDVAWTDSYSKLYLNKTELGTNCQSFTLRDDGRLVWRDSYGNSHYR